MANQQFTVEDDRYRDAPPPAGRSNWARGCVLGCLAVVIISLALGVIATVWIARNWRDWFATTMTAAVNQNIETLDLPEQEEQEVKAEIERAAQLFRDGKISSEQAARLVEVAMNSPLMSLLGTSVMQTQYIEKSGLSDEEKAAARTTVQRFIRGTIDRQISEPEFNGAFQNIADRQPNGQWVMRNNITDADLRAFLADAKKAADDSQVPETPEDFDPSTEIRRIIDEAMGGQAPPTVDDRPAPGENPPIEEQPSDEPPAEEPSSEVPPEEQPSEDAPTEAAPVEGAPAEEAPAEAAVSEPSA